MMHSISNRRCYPCVVLILVISLIFLSIESKAQVPIKNSFQFRKNRFEITVTRQTGDSAKMTLQNLDTVVNAGKKDTLLTRFSRPDEFRLKMGKLMEQIASNTKSNDEDLLNLIDFTRQDLLEKIESQNQYSQLQNSLAETINNYTQKIKDTVKTLQSKVAEAENKKTTQDTSVYEDKFIYGDTALFRIVVKQTETFSDLNLLRKRNGEYVDTNAHKMFIGEIKKDQWKNGISETLKKHIGTTPDLSKTEPAADDLFLNYSTYLTKKETAKANEIKTQELQQQNKLKDSIIHLKDSLLLAIADEKPEAAMLKINPKVNISTQRKCRGIQEQHNLIPLVANNNFKSIELTIDSVAIRVANNTIYQLDIRTHYVDDGIRVDMPLISNDNWGIPLRALIDGNESIKFEMKERDYYLCYSDLFVISFTKDGPVSYSLRDSSYTFFPDPTGKKNQMAIAAKRFLDYISASAFIDLFGLNSQNANKNLVTEVKANFPINHSKKILRAYYLRNLNLEIVLGADLGAFSSAEKTFTTVYDTAKFETQPGVINSQKKNWSNSFDLLQNNFLRINPSLSVLSWDIKKLNLFWDFDLGGQALFTSTKYTTQFGNDSATKSVFSFSPEVSTRFRVNPAPSIGFELLFGYMWRYMPYDRDIYEVTGRESTEELIRKSQLDLSQNGYFRSELNIFFNPKIAKSSTVRGGFYIKLSMLKNTRNVNSTTQAMVGYSTDIRRLFRY